MKILRAPPFYVNLINPLNRKIMKFKFTLLIITVLSISCRRDKTIPDPCANKVQTVANFETYEMLTDTMFLADTIFTNNRVKFKAIGDYESTAFNLSGDPRIFEYNEFSLPFAGYIGNVTVDFTAKKTPNTRCFPNDPGIYNKSKQIRLVEAFDKATLTLSPLLGRYKGSYDTNPTDSFTVRVEYFDSTKYDTGIFGRKNFYWISNFPKGYVNLSSNILYNDNLTELKNGFQPDDMGFKGFVEGGYYQTLYGLTKGYLNKTSDTLTILNSGVSIPTRKFVGKRI